MNDLWSRLVNRVQLTTDGHKPYLEALEGAFGGGVDCAQLITLYDEAPDAEKRNSPPTRIETRKCRIEGKPDRQHVSTCHVERRNLSMWMHMRRFTRLNNAFSKKFEIHMVALYTLWYNFIRIHETLRVTPAMEAGLTDTLWDMDDLVRIMDQRAPKPGPRGPYKRRNSN